MRGRCGVYRESVLPGVKGGRVVSAVLERDQRGPKKGCQMLLIAAFLFGSWFKLVPAIRITSSRESGVEDSADCRGRQLLIANGGIPIVPA